MSALSISLQLPSSTITGIVDALEKEGFVIRKRTGKDARLRYVCLTEVGREQLARYESFLGAVEAETARGIPPEGWEATKRTQRTLEANLERVSKLYWTLAGSGGGEARCAEPDPGRQVQESAPELVEESEA